MAFLVEMRGFAVDEDLDLAHPTQVDLAFGIDLYARYVLQGVGDGTFASFRVTAEVIDHRLAFVDEQRAF